MERGVLTTTPVVQIYTSLPETAQGNLVTGGRFVNSERLLEQINDGSGGQMCGWEATSGE